MNIYNKLCHCRCIDYFNLMCATRFWNSPDLRQTLICDGVKPINGISIQVYKIIKEMPAQIHYVHYHENEQYLDGQNNREDIETS